MSKLPAVLITSLFLSATVSAQQNNPFACLGESSKGKSVGEIRKVIKGKIAIIKSKEDAKIPVDAEEYCVVAELMKRVGDYSATVHYNKAIKAKDDEPLYEYLLAEYLRNFRGALHPLFPESEDHYYQALLKFKQKENKQPFDFITEELVKRGLVALSQTDGFPVLDKKSDMMRSGEFLERPILYFTQVFDYARNTSDFDRRSEVRDFTSESLFSRSSQRLNRDLTEEELRRIIRAKDQFETFDRLRFRYKGGPVVDFTYKYREIDQAQFTNFFEPNKFNDVNLSEYGVSVEKPIDAHAFDLYLRGSFKRARRVGTIEFLPRTKEDINQVEANAVVSRFVGPDKVNIEFAYVFQDIKEDRPNPQKRDRSIYAGKFTYQLFRQALQRVYESRFTTRGIDLFGGVLHDNETFSVVDVNRNDYFVGASLKGFKRFDFTAQPTIFTADVEKNPSQKNSQLRTNATVLFRILDEERQPKKCEGRQLENSEEMRTQNCNEKQPGNPAFLHLVIPFSRDVALTGPNTYENYKIGVGLNAKLFAAGTYRTTFLASIGYDYQNFHRLGRGVNLYSINFSMGF
jgi:hypothetical protein